MNTTLKAGLAAIAVAASASVAAAADLGGSRGSIKDRGYEPAPMAHVQRGPVGNCYFRGDVGYSVSRDPSIKWAVSNGGWAWDPSRAAAAGYNGVYDAATNTYTPDASDTGTQALSGFFNQTSTYVGDSVTNTAMENGWFGGVGIGCGSGSRGIRGEVMLNHIGHRKVDGRPLDYVGAGPVPEPGTVTPVTPPFVDPLHTSISSTTLMFNGYYDFGKFGAFTPYVGAGAGMSYNRMSEVYFTDNPFLTNKIQGDSRLSLAWSLMAGVGYQVTDRAVLDFGYRYMNYGKAQSGVIDSAGFQNPRVYVNDMSAHEFKVGLRYHFGSNDCCAAPAYQPMK
jgi:opacity protein-like surface antigen